MRALPILVALLAPLPALAHPGGDHVHGLAAGFLHPLGGLDHLVAMLAVGMLAGLAGGRARWALPCGFLAGAAAGGVLGVFGVAMPMVEAGILASLIVLGALLACATRLPAALALPLVAGFGMLHGHAHGAELAPGAGMLAFGLGALAATALLHGAGLLLSTGARDARGQLALRFAGGSAAMLGAVMLLG